MGCYTYNLHQKILESTIEPSMFRGSNGDIYRRKCILQMVEACEYGINIADFIIKAKFLSYKSIVG